MIDVLGHLYCTVRLYWARTTWAKEDFLMNRLLKFELHVHESGVYFHSFRFSFCLFSLHSPSLFFWYPLFYFHLKFLLNFYRIT